MSSLRRPKRIVFRGSDERPHPFLVKGGEDLRMDARATALLREGKRQLHSNHTTRKRRQGFISPTIITCGPLSSLVQWLPDTLTLKTIVEGAAKSRIAAGRSERGETSDTGIGTFQLPFHHARGKRENWLKAVFEKSQRVPGCPSEGDIRNGILHAYLYSYALCDRAEGEEIWRQHIAPHAPCDLIRSALLYHASSPEAWVVLRGVFISSLAPLTALTWVLGLGDRHLDNFLFHSPTGGLIGIDFGNCFGFSTSDLPVPEGIPARMTPNFLAAGAPLPCASLIMSGIGATLSAISTPTFRSTFGTLLGVFVMEPIAGNVGKDAKTKILLSALKLRGAHPSPLLYLDALRNQILVPPGRLFPKNSAGEFKRSILQGFREAVMGEGDGAPGWGEALLTCKPLRLSAIEKSVIEGSVRGSLEGNALDATIFDVKLAQCSSPWEQAKSLMEMSSDANILVRQFHGLAPWI